MHWPESLTGRDGEVWTSKWSLRNRNEFKSQILVKKIQHIEFWHSKDARGLPLRLGICWGDYFPMHHQPSERRLWNPSCAWRRGTGDLMRKRNDTMSGVFSVFHHLMVFECIWWRFRNGETGCKKMQSCGETWLKNDFIQRQQGRWFVKAPMADPCSHDVSDCQNVARVMCDNSEKDWHVDNFGHLYFG